MFKLKCRIVENEFEINNLSSEEFDSEYFNLHGMLEFNFGGNLIGYCHGNSITSEEISIGCFQDYSIIRWFENFLKLLCLLKYNKRVIISVLDSERSYIEFTKKKTLLHVRHMKAEDVHIDKIVSVSTPYICVDRLEYIFHHKGEDDLKKEIRFVDCDWGPVIIDNAQFTQEIFHNTELLLNDIYNKYCNIYKSKTIMDIKKQVKLLTG